MKIKRVLSSIVLGAAMLTLAACDSGEPSVDDMIANTFSGECLWIAGDSNIPMEFTGTGVKENVAISINSDCTFATQSPSTGKSYGTLQRTANGYAGTGKTQACPSGNFAISLTDSYTYADCI